MSGIRYLHSSSSLLTNTTLLDVFSSSLFKRRKHYRINSHNNSLLNAISNSFKTLMGYLSQWSKWLWSTWRETHSWFLLNAKILSASENLQNLLSLLSLSVCMKQFMSAKWIFMKFLIGEFYLNLSCSNFC